MQNILTEIKTREALREWLITNHTTEKECWVINSMKSVDNTLLYLDVVEEALCFGWIDSTKKRIDHHVYQRLSPRRKNSSWTELNIQRVYRLRRLGLMSEAGWSVLPPDHGTFKIDDDLLEIIKRDECVYQNFMKMHPLYRRIRIDTIQSVKDNPEQFQKRINRFLENTKDNKMYGQWHDNGRLVEHEDC